MNQQLAARRALEPVRVRVAWRSWVDDTASPDSRAGTEHDAIVTRREHGRVEAKLRKAAGSNSPTG